MQTQVLQQPNYKKKMEVLQQLLSETSVQNFMEQAKERLKDKTLEYDALEAARM